MSENTLQKIARGLGSMKRTVGVTLNEGSAVDDANSSLGTISKGLQKQQAEKKAKRLKAEAEFIKQQEALEKEQALQEQEKADAYE